MLRNFRFSNVVFILGAGGEARGTGYKKRSALVGGFFVYGKTLSCCFPDGSQLHIGLFL